ncbi:hypothetical protein GA0115260_109301, partial [Streptomyces sp. MnatMP-M27]
PATGTAPADTATASGAAPTAPAVAPWTPEAARASITSVVSGTRRGRAEAEEAETRAVPLGDDPSPDREDREGGW